MSKIAGFVGTGLVMVLSAPAMGATTTASSGSEIAAIVELQDGCISTEITVFGQAGHVAGRGGVSTSTLAELHIVVQDTCTDTLLFDGSGVASDVDFAVRGRSADLDDTLSVLDAVSGETFAIPVDVTWRGAGRPDAGAEERCFFLGQGDNPVTLAVHGGYGYFDGSVSGTVDGYDLGDGTLSFFEFGVGRDLIVSDLPGAIGAEGCLEL